jgi:hypothetical protein
VDGNLILPPESGAQFWNKTNTEKDSAHAIFLFTICPPELSPRIINTKSSPTETQYRRLYAKKRLFSNLLSNDSTALFKNMDLNLIKKWSDGKIPQ